MHTHNTQTQTRTLLTDQALGRRCRNIHINSRVQLMCFAQLRLPKRTSRHVTAFGRRATSTVTMEQSTHYFSMSPECIKRRSMIVAVLSRTRAWLLTMTSARQRQQKNICKYRGETPEEERDHAQSQLTNPPSSQRSCVVRGRRSNSYDPR